MRKIYSFMVGAVAMFAAVSCAQELKQDNQLPEGEVVVFEATVDGADTKAHLDGKVSKWDADDKITVFNETDGFEFATSEADVTNDGATARFTYVGNDFSGEKFMAVYPAGTYTADVEVKTVNAYIPTYQGVKAGSYNKDAALAIAYTENTILKFKNATALLKFTIKGSDVKAIEFYGNAEEGDDPIAITGNMLVSLNDNNTVKSVEGLETEFTWEDETTSTQYGTWVKCWADEANYRFTEGATYYAAIAPARFPKGVSVNFIYDNGSGGDAEPVMIKTTSNDITIAANTIVNLGELEHVVPEVETTTYYMRPSSGWIQENGRYAAWCWGEDVGVWCDFIDSDSDGIFEVEIPVTCANAIFLCMKKDTNNDWANELARTSDLTLPTDDKNCYNVYTSAWTTVADAKAYDPGAIYAEDGYVYLKPNSNWTQSNAWFAIYLCNGSSSNQWIKMTKVEGTSYYGAKLPDGFDANKYKNIIFCRMNSANTSTLDWSNRWNQSGDLDCKQIVNGNNCCSINSGQWDCGSNVTWSTLTKLN